MKNVMFDLMVSQPVEGSKFHGGGEYTKTIFKELCDCYLHQINLTVFFNSKLYLDEWILKVIEIKQIHVLDVCSYDQISQTEEYKNTDVFVACLMTGVDKISVKPGMKVIGVYHGFRSLEKPIDNTASLYEKNIKGKLKVFMKKLGKSFFYQYKYNDMRKKICCCTDIIGVSEHSGYAARVFFPRFPQEHIHVFYSPEKYVEPVLELDKVVVEQVILMLGGNRWIKNLYRGAKAIDELFSDGHLKKYIVKVVGGIPIGIQKKLKNQDRFIPLEYLTPENLEKTYKSCDLFFYPSLNEGFGYPPEEVMKYGKTCVISAVNSLTEIYKDSVYYCNPYDINEMKGRILQAVEQKIPVDIIETHYNRIAARQKEDLKSICKLIVE